LVIGKEKYLEKMLRFVALLLFFDSWNKISLPEVL